MMKLNTNELPDIFTKRFAEVASAQLYSMRSSSCNDYFGCRFYHVKTNQSIQIMGAKILNDIPSELKNKVENSSHRLMFKQLKEHFLQQTL